MSLEKSIEMFEVMLSTSASEDVLAGLRPSRLILVVDEHERTVRLAEAVRPLLARLGMKAVIAYPSGIDLSPFLEILSPYVEALEALGEKPSKSILELSEGYSADLVAITMPYPKVDEGTRGSTLEALLREHKRPILIGNEPEEFSRVALIVATNPISDKPLRRAATLASKTLDVVALRPDEVRRSYCEQLVERLSERFESRLVVVQDLSEVEHELAVYELANLGSPVALKRSFLVV